MDALQSIITDLNTLIPIVNHWFHLLSAVIWIGGLAFLVMAVTPGLQKAVAREQIKPITDVFYQHYKKVAGILLVILLFTGGINLHYVNQVLTSQTGSGVQPQGRHRVGRRRPRRPEDLDGGVRRHHPPATEHEHRQQPPLQPAGRGDIATIGVEDADRAQHLDVQTIAAGHGRRL